MQLHLPAIRPSEYRSPQQRVRAATENWGESNLYCANCDSNALNRLRAGTPAIDFVCPQCNAPFQLKGRKQAIGNVLTDAAYSAMKTAILEDRTPNLLALHYEPALWKVKNLVLIPRFALSLSALKKRKPLGPKAERAGWIGCNILLANIPLDARIPIVLDGVPVSPHEVRRQYARLRPFAQMKLEKRGWTLDVLNVVRSLGKQEFSLADVYSFEDSLSRLHPANRHIRDKMRQQLQVLRDLGFVEFLGRGDYRLR